MKSRASPTDVYTAVMLPDPPTDAPQPRPEQTFDALRLNALSDGLFAIFPANMLIREPRAPSAELPKPRWAALWRLVAFAPIIAFVIALVWLYI